ncbi:cation:proton antiporter [Novosphingobium sp. P6W]|uniref:cation:proton antiporter domain-containing protein n=1 Tax=Novosphingobium sp. P6W TaxID=1609758 RepID=UPI0005C2E8F3|nr:cation:proton antiporter [Novosphingobium sp. P6W]AXB80417.1 potassium transporter [Novosphingobium sp. P6W]KIS31308.1 potassium transporter [Novosphingobium sp. P6W]
MTSSDILAHTFIYLLAAVIAVPIAKRVGLGAVLGYILAGALIGPGVLSLTGDTEAVGHVAEFGIVILLFLIGLEVRPQLLWQMKSLIFGLGAAQMAAVSLVITLAGVGLGLSVAAAWTTSVILAMSSTALVMSTLEERGQRSGPVGRACFGVLLFQDMSVIPLFLVVPLLSAAAGEVTNEAATPGWLHGIEILGALLALIVGTRLAVRPLFRFIAASGSREVFTAAALLLVVGVAALMTLVGLSPALGAFIAGMVLGETEFRQEIESDIEPFRGLLLGLFFITVGAGLDLGLLRHEALAVLAIAIGFMIAKAAAMYMVGRAFRFVRIEAITLAVALSQGGEFAFVFVSFAKPLAVLPEHLTRLLPAAVAVSMLLSPLATLLTERLVRWRGCVRKVEREADHEFSDRCDVIVAGFGRFGQIAGRLLQANGHRLSIMDTSLRQIEVVRRFDQRVNFGDATRLDLLRAAGADTAQILIVAIDDPSQALTLVETARRSFPQLSILARAFDRRHAYQLLEAGADHVESETYESSLLLGREALQRLGYRAHRAHRAAAVFRMHDRALFERHKPEKPDDAGFFKASQATVTSLAQLLSDDLSRDHGHSGLDEDWGTRGLYSELKGADQPVAP